MKLLDAPAKGYSITETVKEIEKYKPDLVVVDTSTPSIYNDVEIAKAVKKACPNSFVLLVGTHPSAEPEKTLKLANEIDAVARKEYDYTVLSLARSLEGGGSIKDVEGISYRKRDEIISNPDRPYIEDLDSLPFVSSIYKKHLRIEDYFYAANLHPVITILSGRGCPNRCKFCVLPQTFSGRRYRFRTPENIVRELDFIKREFPYVKEVFFEDDTLAANRKRLRKLCSLIVESNLEITWSCNSRADLDFKTLSLMKEAGCRLLCVGYESGCQEILNNVNKGITIDFAKRFTKYCKELGIKIHGCFIFGLPGETKETIERTIEYAKSLNLYSVQFYPIMVYPGTELYRWVKENNYLTTEDYSQWLTKEGVHNCLIDYPHLSSSELTEVCDRALKEYYFRLSYVMSQLKLSLRHPNEIKRIAKAMGAYFKYTLNRESD